MAEEKKWSPVVAFSLPEPTECEWLKAGVGVGGRQRAQMMEKLLIPLPLPLLRVPSLFSSHCWESPYFLFKSQIYYTWGLWSLFDFTELKRVNHTGEGFRSASPSHPFLLLQETTWHQRMATSWLLSNKCAHNLQRCAPGGPSIWLTVAGRAA